VTERQMAVLHLAPGQVVGAVAVGGRVPTVAEATGGRHVLVRIADQDLEVRVPDELLTALPVEYDADVLARPTCYRVSDAAPPVAWAGPPTAWGTTLSKAGREALIIWDGGADPEIARESLDEAGVLHATEPPGQTRRLIAIDDEPLRYDP
jgi:hypothetical protein